MPDADGIPEHPAAIAPEVQPADQSAGADMPSTAQAEALQQGPDVSIELMTG